MIQTNHPIGTVTTHLYTRYYRHYDKVERVESNRSDDPKLHRDIEWLTDLEHRVFKLDNCLTHVPVFSY